MTLAIGSLRYLEWLLVSAGQLLVGSNAKLYLLDHSS